MNVRSAAITILKKAGTPLHFKEIAKRIKDAGLWTSKSETPQNTISVSIYSDIRKNGNKSTFVKVAPQTFALRDFTEGAQVPEEKTSPSVKKDLKPSTASGGFSYIKCAQMVLEEFGDEKPMHYKEITEKALEKGWLITKGKTPEVAMNAQVATEIKRQQKRGELPRFTLPSRGNIGLSQWVKRGPASQIERHNHQVRKALRERLLDLEPSDFEELISRLLAKMGFETVNVTSPSRDGGIDVRGTLVVGNAIRIEMAVQAKKWKLKNNIQAPTIQQVRGSLAVHEQGLIITTSDFSKGAIKEALQTDKTPIAIMNGKELVELLMEHDIGVRRTSHDLFEIDEEFATQPSKE